MDAVNEESEWLLPLGNGGYAAGTVSLQCARTYHGLLVGALEAPTRRCVLLNHVLAQFVNESGHRFSLGGPPQDGMESAVVRVVSAAPAAIDWEFQAGNTRIRFAINVPGCGNGISLMWRMEGDSVGQLELRPFLSGRSHHGGDVLPMEGWTTSQRQAVWSPHSAGFSVHLRTNGQLALAEALSLSMDLPRETRRGLRDSEVLQSVIRIDAVLSESSPCHLVVADKAPSDWPLGHSETVGEPAESGEALRRAALACVYRRPSDSHMGVLAGFHWFGEWGRDTMIALPGIGLAANDWGLVADILKQWTPRLSMGMLPNRLQVDGASESHNSADASLWYARAIAAWYRETRDDELLQSTFLPALCDIQRHYSNGSRYGIRVDPTDGLLIAGMDGVQLTWMDAKVGDTVMTPRRGKCVELNALFYSLLVFVGNHSRQDVVATRAREQAQRIEEHFASSFWDESEGALRDCVGSNPTPFELRPNQLLAFSCGSGLLPEAQALRALERVENELLTPFGLRTLNPGHVHYRGCCSGAPIERDAAYHQGTVWPWLLGPLADAQLALRGEVSIDLAPLVESLQEGALGHLSEIFDGDLPHTARGAVSQAWSASEVFRISRM